MRQRPSCEGLSFARVRVASGTRCRPCKRRGVSAADVAHSAWGRFRSQTFRDRRKALARKAKHKGLDW